MIWPFSKRDGEPATIEFVIVAEAGPLERQALLLCESIRRFGGRYRTGRITVASPRAARRPAAQTIAGLARLDCTYLPLKVDSVEPEYGTTFRMHVSAAVEALSSADVLVAMDSDMLFVREPDLDLAGHSAALRPVDLQGICTTGPDDPRDPYWQDLCRVTGVDYAALPMIETTAGKVRVKASYNGGLAVVRRKCAVFERTLRYFNKSIAAGMVPSPGTGQQYNAGHGFVSGRASELWGSSQACLSLAIWGSGLSVRTLPADHNVPLHMFGQLRPDQQAMALSILHYHDVFDRDPTLNPVLNGSANVPSDFREWIKGRVSAAR